MKQVEKKNKQLYNELVKYQQEIIEYPLGSDKLKGDLKEFRSLDFTFRKIAIRICYAYHEDDNHVQFVYAGTRENFYDEVKRDLK